MLNQFLKAGDRFLDWYERWLLKPVLIFLNSSMTLIILYSVFMRYVLNKAPTWSEELTRYVMVWAALLGMGIAARYNKHIGLSDLVVKLWGRWTNTVHTIGDILSALFWFLVFVTGISMTIMVAPQRSPSMNLPMWIAYLAVPVGGAFAVIELLFVALRRVKARQEKRS
ncbi:MAG: hypothetical protein Kow009_04780 [Spirochaetales bacterium]